MPMLTVLVGLPGSGKSTCIQSAYTNPTQFVYSTDDLLEVAAKELGSTYNDVFETLIKSVTKSADNMLAGAIKQNKDVVWDQTNMSAKKRAAILSKFPTAYQKVCVCFVPPQNAAEQQELNRRLANRPGKTIPAHIMRNMASSYVMPTREEGFDVVEFYNIFGQRLS